MCLHIRCVLLLANFQSLFTNAFNWNFVRFSRIASLCRLASSGLHGACAMRADVCVNMPQIAQSLHAETINQTLFDVHFIFNNAKSPFGINVRKFDVERRFYSMDLLIFWH